MVWGFSCSGVNTGGRGRGGRLEKAGSPWRESRLKPGTPGLDHGGIRGGCQCMWEEGGLEGLGEDTEEAQRLPDVLSNNVDDMLLRGRA